MSSRSDDPVRAQYEQWVYPEPIPDLSDPGIGHMRDAGDPDVLGNAYWPDRPRRGALDILVAGCGANAAARYAFHHPESKVTGVDLSEASLAHEQRLKERHRLSNLTLRRCRIEDLEDIGAGFDLIDCSGVLHHLPKPQDGIRALSKALRPDGVMFLMLYAPYGRAGVYLLQQLFRLLGLGQSRADVALARQALDSLPEGHPARRYAESAGDLGFDAGLVDTFLHPQDRAYSVRECLELLDGAGLVLQGWADNYFYYPDWQLMHDPELAERIRALPEARQWQAMEIWHGRIPTHSFFACHRTRDPAGYRIDFEQAGFMAMVPVPRLGLACVEEPDRSLSLERKPFPKIALGGSHAAVFAQVDGQKSVGECFRASGVHADPGQAEAFCRDMFRGLWRLGYLDMLLHAK